MIRQPTTTRRQPRKPPRLKKRPLRLKKRPLLPKKRPLRPKLLRFQRRNPKPRLKTSPLPSPLSSATRFPPNLITQPRNDESLWQLREDCLPPPIVPALLD